MSQVIDAPPMVGAQSDETELFQPMTQRRVLRLAVPIIGENFLQTLVVAADTLMVARLGKEEVAGVGTSAELVFLIIAILTALHIGATVLVSQAFGAGDRERANRLARQAIVWGVVVAIPLSTIMYVLAPTVISLFGTEPDVADFATTYLQITAATAITLVMTFVCGAIFRGAGDSRTPLFASMAANIVNLIVGYSLIFGHFGMPKLGVAGSAWGGAAARAASATIMLLLLIGGRRVISIRGRSGWRPHLDIGRQLARLGIPSALEELLLSSGFITILRVVSILGTASLAAQNIGFTALSVAFMPGFAFAIATTSLVGQSVGARRLDEAKAAFRIALGWSVVWMVTGGLIYFIFAKQVMRIFTDDLAVRAAGVDALRALSVGLPFWAIWGVSGGALRGSGDTRTPLLSSGITVWGAVALAFFAVEVLHRGLGAVWLTFLLTSPIGAYINWHGFRKRVRAAEAGTLELVVEH